MGLSPWLVSVQREAGRHGVPFGSPFQVKYFIILKHFLKGETLRFTEVQR